jgi:hypothetical protein
VQIEVNDRIWLLLTVRVENAEEEGRLIGVMALSASEGAPIWGGPVRRRFAARERADMISVVVVVREKESDGRLVSKALYLPIESARNRTSESEMWRTDDADASGPVGPLSSCLHHRVVAILRYLLKIPCKNVSSLN